MGTHTILSILLLLFVSLGFGIEAVMGNVEHIASLSPEKENIEKSRKMMADVADYLDPRPNRPVVIGNIRRPPPPVDQVRKMIVDVADYPDTGPNVPGGPPTHHPPHPIKARKMIVGIADYPDAGPPTHHPPHPIKARKMIVGIADYPDAGPNQPGKFGNHKSPPPTKV